MPVIEHDAEIAASQEQVFALVSRVEEFAAYSDAIDTIERLGERRYLWRVRIAGLPLRFDIEITELEPPERFAWRSVSGVPCRGAFAFTPTAAGTRIQLTLTYHLGSRALERVVSVAARPLLRQLSRDIIGRVEARLRAQQRPR